MNVFIFHGTGGSPEGNWFPWLKQQLINQGIEVFVPKFPTPEGQSLKAWLKVFEKYQNKVTQETIFVGHSMGPGFIFRLLEKSQVKIKGAILASPFIGFLDNEWFDNLNKTFIDHPFNWEKIKKNCPRFAILSGDNDPYVAIKQPESVRDGVAKKLIDEGKRLASKLNVSFKLIKGGGHLNAETNYLEFPEVLTEINKIILSVKKEKWLLVRSKKN